MDMEDVAMDEASRVSTSETVQVMHHVTIHRYSDLDKKTQEVALAAIASINLKTTTTQGRTNWSNYTPMIQNRLEHPTGTAKKTLYVAEVAGRIVGYVAYYTRQDAIPWSIQSLLSNENEAYCSWTAIDPEFRGGGVAMPLRMGIFADDTGITTFKGHIKKDNIASIKSIDKFKEKGYTVEWREEGDQLLCIVTKPSSK